MRPFVLAAFVVAAAAGCNLTDSSSRFTRPGLLRISAEDSINWVAPDTVLLNQNFNITVTTIGGSCDSKATTEVLPLANGSIDFRPWDRTEVIADKPCPLVLQNFTHTGTLSRSVTGPVDITLWGRDWNNVMTSRVKTVVVK
jgi:hypothetical protein